MRRSKGHGLLSYRRPKLLLLLVVVLVVLAMLRRSRVSSFVLRTRGPVRGGRRAAAVGAEPFRDQH